METIYFSLGIVTALVAILLVIGVVMVARLTKKQSNQEDTINHIERYNQEGRNDLVRDLDEIRREIHKQFDEVHRTIAQLNDEVHRTIHERSTDLSRELERVDQEAHRHVDELNKYVDSRFDKTLDNVSKLIADHNKLSEKKDLLKG
jgi:DNA anti-recombination protein RmuC